MSQIIDLLPPDFMLCINGSAKETAKEKPLLIEIECHTITTQQQLRAVIMALETIAHMLQKDQS